ncbi:MAG: fasciclin domain-containing protein [Pseudomonadales bacterium]
MKTIRIALAATALAIAATQAHADDHDLDQRGSIVDVATQAGSFVTLLTALDAAGLTETLSGAGPFTVFAPTDEAFAALPAGALDGLLADPDALTQVLVYHVVAGETGSAAITGLSSLTTLQGGTLAISTDDGVQVDNARVVAADVGASNGVIHVIDAVLLP